MNKKNKMYRLLSCLRVDIQELPLRLFSYICIFFPIQSKKVVIDYPNQRETNVVTEYLINAKEDFDIVWAIRNDKTYHEGVRLVKADSFRYVLELMTAGIWIDNSRKKNWVHKRNKQLYIQTWHGAVFMKKIEKDAEDVLPAFYIKKAKHDSTLIDYFVAETKYIERSLKKTFWYEGKVLRGEFKDGIFQEIGRTKVMKSLHIKTGNHILLYVPTFRLDSNMECYDMNYEKVLDSLENKFGGNWSLIIRLHPNIAAKSDTISFDERVINGTYYPDFGELINISDVLITDYSSCMFYGYRAKKNVFIYASDFDEYMTYDRGGYLDYADLPASVSKTTDELVDNIYNFEENRYKEQVNKFNNVIGYYENNIMDQIMDIINKHIEMNA